MGFSSITRPVSNIIGSLGQSKSAGSVPEILAAVKKAIKEILEGCKADPCYDTRRSAFQALLGMAEQILLIKDKERLQAVIDSGPPREIDGALHEVGEQVDEEEGEDQLLQGEMRSPVKDLARRYGDLNEDLFESLVAQMSYDHNGCMDDDDDYW
ncbi:uncharacterized protein MKK02DRAFT_41823 [Dioszegia hungarica]|uniref:Uncharacterized protein n=1 Tax=Dioszegia hungarica TaxID=4972 RepID=A0AA38HE20_9TREE|nr:uncharacterized protein MKK02DRAFT_41823 [Dioszegia hungarica]KAI9638796.1 hypothetical protein MKK02DRAFT_41823 [Dioszegia hungarica]